ncbi:hypothetical protein COS81_02080 [candidate division WWE3 bacterium CG06_land_8_20_14_3_00_42_16]|uniref:Glycosyltransferase family 1 protein n=2 Tax=Katanobacteria TaxID=422282 RepID=A0A2M7ANJ1_UNCKA|nr:MAG: hypothetical protein COS81_02080 [candidate division WWE3 bacterium CG06_land_8_20_14_3_00_42_16]
MKIGIDARFWGPKGTGIGRFTKNLVLELEKIDRENEYVVFLRKENSHLYEPANPRFRKVIIDTHPYSLCSQVFDWLKIKKLRLDLVHFTHFSYPIFYPGKFVISIHDLIKTQFQEKSASSKQKLIYRIKHWGYQLVLRQAIFRSAKIITATAFVKNEISKHYPLANSKIVTAYYGTEDRFFTVQKEAKKGINILAKYQIQKPYLIYVGNLYLYKNVDKLIEVMESMSDRELTLAIVCSRSIFYDSLEEKIKDKKLASRVKLLGFVPDEMLVTLYQNALAFITASLSEGFGITGLEAMAAGCPVLSSNFSCLPEVYGEAALYFNPDQTDKIVDLVYRIRKEEKLRSEMIKKGKRQVQKYSWSKMAKEVLAVYEEVAGQ